MTKKISRASQPDPRWIFTTSPSHTHSITNFLYRVDQQLGWLLRRLTPNMQEALKKKQEKPQYTCNFCGEVFLKGCALGGHISKRHANKKVKVEESSVHYFEHNSSTFMPNNAHGSASGNTKRMGDIQVMRKSMSTSAQDAAMNQLTHMEIEPVIN